MFEAAYKGDIKAVEKLTIKKKIGEQAFIASTSSISGETPLHLALKQGHVDCLLRMIEIAIEQYTPIEPPKKVWYPRNALD